MNEQYNELKETVDGQRAVSYTHLDVYKRQLKRLKTVRLRKSGMPSKI